MSVRSTLRGAVYGLARQLLGDEHGRVSLPTLRGPARGLRFRLDLRVRVEPAYFLGNYERSVVERVARICRPGWVVWDCGVYLGYYTTLFAKIVGPQGKVIGFEPDPRNLARAEENVAANGFTNAQFVHAAIGGSEGEVDFILSNNTNSHLPGVYIGGTLSDYQTRERRDDTIRVRCMSLDEIYRRGDVPRPDLIKIDIEGAELEALGSMRQLVREVQPLIVLELHNPECDRAAWEFAREEGYSLLSLDTGEPVERLQDVGGTLLCSPVSSAARVESVATR